MKAAVMISRIMPLVLAVCTKQCCSSYQLSLRLFQAKNSDAMTPSAADSVVVAKPLYRLPITMKNTTPGGTRSLQQAHPSGQRYLVLADCCAGDQRVHAG